MTVFDDMPRDNAEPRTHTESRFDWLSRSARPEAEAVRREIERWFSRYPAEEQDALRRRFRTEFEAAFFELFLHELLLRCAYDVTVHPEVPGTTGRPDFLAERGAQGFYLEASLATDMSEEERAADAIRNRPPRSTREMQNASTNWAISIGICVGTMRLRATTIRPLPSSPRIGWQR